MRFPRTFILACSWALPADGIDLTVTPGPGPGDVALQWTSNQAVFQVYRSWNAVAEIRIPTDALANYDANVLPVGSPGFSPIAPLTSCR